MSEGLIAVRNSKRPGDGLVTYDRHEWRSFLAGVRNGEFDDLAQTPPGGIALPGVSAVSATETNRSRA